MLTEALLTTADRVPERVAVSDPFGMELTYAHLVRAAAAMKDIVEKETDCPRVGIFLPSSVGFVVGYYGIQWAERTAVPLNLLLHPAELTKIVTDAGLDTIITFRFAEDVAHLNESVDALPVDKKLYLNDLSLPQRIKDARHSSLPRPPRVGPDDVATLLYTSGTSGDPKGVMLTQSNLDGNARGTIEHIQATEDERFLGLLPLFHSFGMTTMMLVPLTVGGTVYYLPRFVPSLVMKSLAERGITTVYGIASMYATILRLKDVGPENFKNIHMCASGGEPLPPALYEGWLERFGFPVLEGYGLTETSPVVSGNQAWANRPGTAGRLLQGVEARAIDNDDNPLPPGEVGEIVIRGYLIMKGYYNRPAETAEAIDPDGWFRTGDVGWVDQDNYIAITGRKKEMIIVSGENVYPREIESVLEQHPAVAESAVIPETVGGTRGEAPVGFVVLKSGQAASDAELREHCRDHLPQYKIPKVVWIAEDLPRGPTGKILKRALDPTGPPKSA